MINNASGSVVDKRKWELVTGRDTSEEGDDRVSMGCRGGRSRRRESRLEARGAVRDRIAVVVGKGSKMKSKGFLMLPRRVLVVS